MRFEDGKTEALNLRVSPAFKAALRSLAEDENRSMVNMLEVLVMEKLATLKKAGGAKPKAARAGAKERQGQT
jgi:hypothetical protein